MSGAIENKSIISPTNALRKLSIEPQTPHKHRPKDVSRKDKDIPSGSWEDEITSSGDEEYPYSPQQPTVYPSAPPPTPISPITQPKFESPFDYNVMGISMTRNEQRITSRPDKTDAIARRLIAGALGVKPPPKSEEQKAYEAAMKGKEIKRRAEEKELLSKALEDAERSKEAMWSD
ncbi:putative ubiquitin-like protein smt3 [Erysiphe necator]|uniref:Putative ubiquitin-like protein smt3 n=1 Tax=Uncinula necator TaxID=52586 RepID=A0A0B1NXS1_UNCNE|nr:putative ubiquitin-like protein smt3 [Erysiphe necator]